MDLKTCTRCNITQSIDNFGKNKATKDSKHYYCKICVNEINSNRSQVGRKKSGNHDPRPSSLEWAEIILKQDGRCALCNEPGLQLVYDHNHETLEFRGALCTSCNLRLGRVEQEKEWYCKAFFYLNWLDDLSQSEPE